MPNWCNNTITITHPDPAKLEALAAAVREGKFCDFIHPVPEDLHITAGREGSDDDPKQIALEAKEKSNREKYGYANWYDFCVNEWGTKWDVESYEGEDLKVEDGKLSFGFDSAWSPPINLYEKMFDQGYNLKAFYWEPGMGFCGKFDADGDDYYDYSGMSAKEFAKEIDPELDEVMCIIENLETWEEENKEEEDA